MPAQEARLKQNLYGWQIIFIVLSAVIGNGIFYNDGEALRIAGPSGLLLSVVVVGVIAICVMEGLSEFIQLFPVPNAIVEYVRAFVDEDLAWLVGIAYWYTYAALFATQNASAAQHAQFWGLSQTLQTIVFYFLAPVSIVVINLLGVFFYGVVESVGGVLKVILVLGVSVFLYAIARKNNITPSPIGDGFKNDMQITPNHEQAVCYVIPLVTFSYLGVELVAVTAHEAKNKRALRYPSRIVAYVVLLLYLLCVLGEIWNVDWNNSHLPSVTDGTGQDVVQTNRGQMPRTTSAVILAAYRAGTGAMSGFLNGCFIFSTLSAGNTALYVASRTLYGLSLKSPRSNWLGRQFHKLSVVEPWTREDSRWGKLFGGTPIASLAVSALAFAWIPYLQYKHIYSVDALTEIIIVSSSVSCVVVWAALCLAFIRYEQWLQKCDNDVKNRFQEYDRRSPGYQAKTFTRLLQPWIAYLGFLGCLMIIAFSTATWWNRHVTVSKVAESLGALIVLCTLFVVFKLGGFLVMPREDWKARWIKIGDADGLHARFRRFEYWAKEGDEPTARAVQDNLYDDAQNPVVRVDTGTPLRPGQPDQTLTGPPGAASSISSKDERDSDMATSSQVQIPTLQTPITAASDSFYGNDNAEIDDIDPTMTEAGRGGVPLQQLPAGPVG